jgi:glycine/D-amino acid oxidase-like deaminating enzyme
MSRIISRGFAPAPLPEFQVFWSHDAPAEACSDLKDDLEVDFLIIGGGYTGLSAARFLREAEPSLSIAVVERHQVGFGASGRNSGYLTPLIGHDMMSLVRRLGEERARAVYGFGREAVAHVGALIREHGIDCDFEGTGLANPAVSSRQLRRAEGLARAAEQLGCKVELWDARACREKLGVSRFRGALYDPQGGILNPYKLARGMLKLVRSCGVQVFENSEVADLELGPIVTAQVRSAEGGATHRIRARYVLLATNAYTTGLRPYRSYYTPLHVYHVVTEPLSAAQLDAIGGWPGREGFYTLHHILYALRLTSDNRLLIATGNVRYFGGDRLHVADRPEEYRKLEAAIRWLYPSLAGVKTAFRWEGVIAVTLSDFPALGRGGPHDNVFHSLAYCGHGVSLASYAGSIVRDLFLERPGPHGDLPFVGRPPFPPVPRGPLRKLVASGYIGLLRGLDAWANLSAP